MISLLASTTKALKISRTVLFTFFRLNQNPYLWTENGKLPSINLSFPTFQLINPSSVQLTIQFLLTSYDPLCRLIAYLPNLFPSRMHNQFLFFLPTAHFQINFLSIQNMKQEVKQILHDMP